MNLSVLITQMSILFILISCGFFCNKKNLINKNQIPFLSKIVLNVGIPGAILASVSAGTTLQPKELYLYLLGFLLFNILCGVFSKFIVKVLRISKNGKQYEFMLMFSNIAFMGLPIVKAVFGNEALIYATLFLLPSNLVLFSYGEFLMKDTKEFSLKKFFNLPIIASILAVIICIFNYQPPYLLTKSLEYLGNITTPLAMIIIGVSLSGVSIFEALKNRDLLIFLFVKMIVLPLVYWKILDAMKVNELIVSMLVLLMALPIPSNTVVYASIYNKNVPLATHASVLTNVVSILTIPAVFLLISIF